MAAAAHSNNNCTCKLGSEINVCSDVHNFQKIHSLSSEALQQTAHLRLAQDVVRNISGREST